VQAQQAPADDQRKLNGALDYLEHFATRRIVEAVGVDASQMSSFRREPGAEPEVWTMTGTAAITDFAGNREQHPYRTQLTILCQAYERTACWDLKSLTLGQWNFSETSPSIVSLAALNENPGQEADPTAAATSNGEAAQVLADASGAEASNAGDVGLLQKMSEDGDPEAQYQLAEVYRIGFPVEQDTAKAIELYKRSAGQGYAASQFRLGDLYEEGGVLERDLGKAVESYRKAADQGHSGAQYALAHIYHLGSGVTQDMAAAMVWYRKAALQGDEWSQLALGDQYRIGLAVPRDLAQSTKWYRRAAERGNIFAQFELGNAYRFGNGVERDATQAIAWYRLSAEAGNPSAKLALTELENGGAAADALIAPAPGVSQDPGSDVLAGTWEGELASSETVADASGTDHANLLLPDSGGAPEAASSAQSSNGADPVAELAYAADPSYNEEETVSQLLSLAQDQVAHLALTTPEGDNAYETYRLVLSLQPNNEPALIGIEQIGVEYASLAEQTAARGSIEQARVYAGKAVALAPNHPDVFAMQAALRAQEQAAAEAAPPAPSVAAPSTLSTTSETSTGVQAGSADIEVAALTDSPVAAGGSETLAIKRTQAPKPELLTSGLLYAVSGLDAHQVGNYDEAIEFYTLAIEAGDLPDRSLVYVYNNRGASYRNMNNYNQAIEDYDAAIRLNPEYSTAYYNRGIAYDRKGFHGLAIDDFDTAIRLNPDLSDAYNQRGLAYVKDGRYDIAIENFSQAIRLDPELDSAYFNRGLVYHSTGETDRAAEDIRKSHALDPDNPEYGKKMRELGIL
jgi:TPR repeat protein